MADLVTSHNNTVSSSSHRSICCGDYLFGENCSTNNNTGTSSPEVEHYKIGKFDNTPIRSPLAESPKSDYYSLFSLSPAASISCSSSSRHSESPSNGDYSPKLNENGQSIEGGCQKTNIFRNLEHFFRNLNKNHDQNSCDSGFESCPGSSADSKSSGFPVIVESGDFDDDQTTGTIACVWADCKIRLDITSSFSHNDDDHQTTCSTSNDERPFYELHEHVMETHVKTLRTKNPNSSCKPSGCEKFKQSSSSSAPNYACMWRGCRFYEQQCKSYEWLENHVFEKHGGPKPYRCVVENCAQRFTSRFYLEKHVNAHFSMKMIGAASSSNIQSKKIPLSNSSSDSAVISRAGKQNFHIEHKGHSLRCDSFEEDSRLDDLLRWKAILAYKERQNKKKWKTNPISRKNQHAKGVESSNSGHKIANSRHSCLSDGNNVCSSDDYPLLFHDICCAEDVENLLKKHDQCSVAKSEITFCCLVLAHRKMPKSETTKDKNCTNLEYLCEFSPHGILPPMWIPEQSFHPTLTVPLKALRKFGDRS